MLTGISMNILMRYDDIYLFNFKKIIFKYVSFILILLNLKFFVFFISVGKIK
mgnify:CR=1 FL=1